MQHPTIISGALPLLLLFIILAATVLLLKIENQHATQLTLLGSGI